MSHVVEQYNKGASGSEVVKAPGFDEVPTIQVIDPLVIELPKPQDNLFPAPPQPPFTAPALIEPTIVSNRVTLHLSIQNPDATSTTTSSSSSPTATWTLQDEFKKENAILGQ